jgi:1-acyl-sn-glycerol-3-phosphate acyltransferase
MLRVLWYRLLQAISRSLCAALFQLRVSGRHHVPLAGAALLVSNHQSYLDPVLVGAGLRRRLNYLARESLFRLVPFRWLIQSLDAIPIQRDGMGLSGLKETLRRLRRGEAVLLFPEGTRSRDGSLSPLRSGFYAVVRRARVPVIPVRIEGAYRAWPRSALLPRPHPIRVTYGMPLTPVELDSMDEHAVVAWVARQLGSADCYVPVENHSNRRPNTTATPAELTAIGPHGTSAT